MRCLIKIDPVVHFCRVTIFPNNHNSPRGSRRSRDLSRGLQLGNQPWRLRILARSLIFVHLSLALCSQTPRQFRIARSRLCHNCNGLSLSASHREKICSRTSVVVRKTTRISGREVLSLEVVTKSVREIGR